MVAVPRNIPNPEDGEQRLLIHGISWDQYGDMVQIFEDAGVHLRVTYLDGAMELMSPGRLHEEVKIVLGRLLEAYAEENDLNLNGLGSTTFRRKAKKRGAEPDECYCIGHFGKIPQLAIEIVYSPPKIDKLDVYRGLAVPEVWIYRQGALSVFMLDGGRYEERSQSVLLPALDLPHLLSFVRPGEDQTPLVKAYRVALRAKG